MENKKHPEVNQVEISTDEGEIQSGQTLSQAPVSLSNGRFWLTLAIMSISLSSCGIDLNVLGDAAITIAIHFNSLNRLVWMSAATVMTAAATMLIWGRLYSIFEAKHLLLLALLIMAVSELLAGISTSFRLALSNVLVGTMTVTSLVTNGIQRPLYVGLVTGCFGLMIKFGPFISGGLLKRSSGLWRWCFLLQLPIIGVLAVMTLCFFPRLGHVSDLSRKTYSALDRPRSQVKDFVLLLTRASLQAGSITALIFPLMADHSSSLYGWTSYRMIVCYVVCPLLGVGFLLLESKTEEVQQLLPISAMRQDRTILCMGIVTFCSCLIIFPSVFYLPLVFQVVFGSSPLRSAVQMLPNALLGTIACVAAGKLAEITGYFTPTCIAFSLLDILACGLIWSLKSIDPLWKVYLYTCLLGVSSGGLSALGTPVTIERVALNRMGSASAFINLCVILGAAVGLAGSSVIYNAHVISTIEAMVREDANLAKLLASAGTKSVWLDLEIILSPATSASVKALFRAGFMKAFDQAHIFYLIVGGLSLIASLACRHQVMLSHRKSSEQAN